MTGRILIVDDDISMCEMLEDELKHKGFRTKSQTSADEAFNMLLAEEFDVVLTDLIMPGTNGIELCERIAANRPDVLVIVVTAFGNLDTAISAMRAGAYDFITKPFELDQVVHTVTRAVQHRQLMEKVKVLSRAVEESQRFEELLGASPPMKKLYDMLKRVADSDASVMISGESGTGKELVAHTLHNRSSRGDSPFIAINCAAMPEMLLESELFGHVSGAFTDARNARKGLFFQADGGTLFLDELADMPLALQPKLLRALEQRSARPVGSNEEIPFDVRVIASTNRDLESAVEDGLFREDLYYRINVITIDLPPLRKRGHDILLLARHFVTHFAGITGKHVDGISDPAAERLLSYVWPGNVRELKNCIERAVTLTRHEKLIVEDLPENIRSYRGYRISDGIIAPSDLVPMEEIERRYITHIMQVTDGNKATAARILGFDRKTLYRKLKRYGISDSHSSADE